MLTSGTPAGKHRVYTSSLPCGSLARVPVTQGPLGRSKSQSPALRQCVVTFNGHPRQTTYLTEPQFLLLQNRGDSLQSLGNIREGVGRMQGPEEAEKENGV